MLDVAGVSWTASEELDGHMMSSTLKHTPEREPLKVKLCSRCEVEALLFVYSTLQGKEKAGSIAMPRALPRSCLEAEFL